jgi:hypothetical protein
MKRLVFASVIPFALCVALVAHADPASDVVDDEQLIAQNEEPAQATEPETSGEPSEDVETSDETTEAEPATGEEESTEASAADSDEPEPTSSSPEEDTSAEGEEGSAMESASTDGASADDAVEDEKYPGRPDAPDMTTDELWDAYAQTQGRFEGLLSQSESLDPETTTGSRVYAQTIETGVELQDLLQELISRENELSDEEMMVGTDSLLTIQQVLGSLFVEVSECRRGKEMLGELREDPRVDDRPVLQESTERWYNNAVRCVERQRVEEEIARARQEGHEEDVSRLEQELSSARQAEEEAETEASGTGSGTEDDEDTIRLSRTELMNVLRMSQQEREQAYGSQGQYEPAGPPGPRREFGLAVFGAAIGSPDFALDLFFDEHASTWSDGGNFNAGFEFFVRKHRRVSHGFRFTYANLHTEDHWWIQNNAERGDAKWVENNLQPLGITYRYEAIAPIGNKERFHIYFGLDFGVNIIPSGQWSQREVNDAPGSPCFQSTDPAETDGDLGPFQSGGACGPDQVRAVLDGTSSTNIFGTNEVDDTVLPPILPSIGFGIGFRYMIADIVGVGIEAGWRDFYAYAGGKLEFIIAKQKSEAQKAAEAREAARREQEAQREATVDQLESGEEATDTEESAEPAEADEPVEEADEEASTPADETPSETMEESDSAPADENPAEEAGDDESAPADDSSPDAADEPVE